MINRFQCNACGTTYDETDRNGIINFHACGPLPPDKNGIQVERPNKRDENTVVIRGRGIVGIIAEGLGVTCLNSDKVSQPVWQTAMDQRIADQEAKDDA